MRVLVRKMEKLGLLKVEIVVGIIVMAVALIGLPVGTFASMPALLAEPMAWGIVLLGMAFSLSQGIFALSVRTFYIVNSPKYRRKRTGNSCIFTQTKKRQFRFL